MTAIVLPFRAPAALPSAANAGLPFGASQDRYLKKLLRGGWPFSQVVHEAAALELVWKRPAGEIVARLVALADGIDGGPAPGPRDRVPGGAA